MISIKRLPARYQSDEVSRENAYVARDEVDEVSGAHSKPSSTSKPTISTVEKISFTKSMILAVMCTVLMFLYASPRWTGWN